MQISYPLHHLNDVAIHTLDNLQKNEAGIQPACYKIFWIKQGSGTFHCNKHNYTIRPGCFYWLGKETIAAIAGNYMEGYAICMAPAFFCSLQAEPGFSALLHLLINKSGRFFFPVNTEDAQAAEDVLIKLRKEFINTSVLKEEMFKSLLKLLLLYMAREFVAGNSISKSRETVIMEAFAALLVKNISTQKKVSDYARALYVTPGYLNHAIKKASGYTASFHIQQQVIRQAKQKALCTGYSMKEIAYGLGFDDMAHFSKFFKNNTGISFTNYKKGITAASA